MFDVFVDGEEGFLFGYRIGFDDGVDSFEFGVNVFGCVVGFVVEFEVGCFGDFVEVGLLEGDG